MVQKKILSTLAAIVLLAIVWQLIAISIGYPAIFPSLIDLIGEVFSLFGKADFYSSLSNTILRGLLGFALAFIPAFLLATVATFSAFWKDFFHPLIVVIRSIPVISFVLIAILWFSPANLPVFIAFMTMFPILYQNTLTGLEHTDRKWVEMAQTFGKTPFQCFVFVYMPASKKIIFDGVSTAMGFGWRAIIIGEVLAQPIRGIGTSMKHAQAFINVSELIAWTVVAIAVSYFFEGIIKLMQKCKLGIILPKPQKYLPTKNTYTSNSKAIIVQNINKNFNSNNVFDNYSTQFDSHKVYCIKGASGKGKTTLLRLLSGLEKPDSGEIKVPDSLRIAYSFQDVRLLPWLTTTENIVFALHQKHLNKHEVSNLVAFLLEKMELTEHANKYPHELSGGQQQRIGLARALSTTSDVLLLDEPLNGLDNALKIRIIDFISEWISTSQPLVIWATHEKVELKEISVNEVIL
jgi:ABC-type nitrate/sulfonate/bicarbonate transport system ATPase subunit/ABC-type nitrate/sulfonate/bicarbonate transport system permease component